MAPPPGPTQKPATSVGGGVGAAEPALAQPGGAAGGPGADPALPGRPPLPREVLECVRARDPEALAAFFERYFDQVYGLVHHLLGHRAAAEDVTQDVFLKVHRAAAQLDAGRDPAPWLAAIATNACRDVWRSGAYRMGRRSASIEQDTAVTMRLASRGGDPEHATLSAERERLVREAIARLPEPLRVAVLMYDFRGMSHQEIAEAMGLNHAAARKRYSRALAALAKLLKESLG